MLGGFDLGGGVNVRHGWGSEEVRRGDVSQREKMAGDLYTCTLGNFNDVRCLALHDGNIRVGRSQVNTNDWAYSKKGAVYRVEKTAQKGLPA